MLSPEHESIFAYTRTLGDTIALIVMNFSGKKVKYGDAIAGEMRKAGLVQGNVSKVDSDEVELSGFIMELEPYEGRVYLTGGAGGERGEQA